MAAIQVAAKRAHLTETGFIAESAVQAAFDMPAPTFLSSARELATERLAAAITQLQDTLPAQGYDDVTARLDWMCDEILKLRR
jgi:secreted protein with Ig-like and vWFA domain